MNPFVCHHGVCTQEVVVMQQRRGRVTPTAGHCAANRAADDMAQG